MTLSGLNPTAEICGLLHYQGVKHDWLTLAIETCFNMIIDEPPHEAHSLYSACRLAEYLPNRDIAMNLIDTIAASLPKASYFIAEAPVTTYGLTPLHFAPRPDSIYRHLFKQGQIDDHLEDLMNQQQEDGGWPISWKAPGQASISEWRGRLTLDAVCRLVAYDVIGNKYLR